VEDSGGKWSIEHFQEGVRNTMTDKPQTPNPKPSNLISHILSNLKTHRHYTSQTLVCQAYSMHKKSPKTREKFTLIVMLFKESIMISLENQDIRFVIYHRGIWVYS